MISSFDNDVVTILRSTNTIGNGGEIVKIFSSNFDIVGSFQSQRGDWSVLNNQEAYRKNKTFYCNYTTSILQTDRVKFEGQIYEILDILNMEYKRLEIPLKGKST